MPAFAPQSFFLDRMPPSPAVVPLPYSLVSQEWLQRLHRKDSGIPYGIALALGALMIYPETEWMKAVDLSRFIGH